MTVYLTTSKRLNLNNPTVGTQCGVNRLTTASFQKGGNNEIGRWIQSYYILECLLDNY